MNMESSNSAPQDNKIEVKREQYLDLINDFGVFITLNASRLDQQIEPGKETELQELLQDLRKPIINGLNYADFTSQYGAKLTESTISKALITQIYNFLLYIEPRLSIFKSDSQWVQRFSVIKQKYTDIVSGK